MSKSKSSSIKLISLIIAITIAWLAWQSNQSTTDSPSFQNIKPLPKEEISLNGFTYYKVTRVIDGDTIEVNLKNEAKTVRLIGIDTPETVDQRKPVECFGQEASAKTKSLLEGKIVRLEPDATQANLDKYGRLLRYVFLPDGTHVNKLLIAEGYAFEYTYETPYKYQAEFKATEQEAQQLKKGLWAEGACLD